MRKLLSLLPLACLLFLPALLNAQTTNYNWLDSRFSAAAAQAKRVCLGRVYYNAIHWGGYPSIKFTLRQEYYTSGTIEYVISTWQGGPRIYCTSALGAHVDKGRLVLGDPTAAGSSYDGQPNYYRNIYLDVDNYTGWQVAASVTGQYFEMDKFTLGAPDQYSYATFFSNPVIENIPAFAPDIKKIVLADEANATAMMGIGIANPKGKLHIYKPTTGDYDATLILDGPVNSERSIVFYDEGQMAWWLGRDNTPTSNLYNGIGFWNATVGTALLIKDDGRITIGGGIPKPNAKLTVDGTIHATKVKVEQNVWADHVFEEGYPLPTLPALESYIRENKHLPEIPTAKEVAAEGIDLGDMNRKLLQKIEEQTLHLIDLHKRVEALEKENRETKKKNITQEG